MPTGLPAAARSISVVIPVHNRREVTLAGLRSLAKVDTTGIDLRIVVVDDGSTDGTGAAIRAEFPDIEVIDGDGSLHYAGGTNRGIAAAMRHDPEFVVTANDDADFDENVLVNLVKCADRNPGAVVGALLVRQEDPSTAFQVGLHFDVSFGGWHVPQQWRVGDLPAGDLDVETIVGNCLMVPTELIRRVGLMDEQRFPVGAADVQWVRRMQRLGRRCVIATDAIVYCRANDVLPSLRSLGPRQALRTLFLDHHHPLNLRRHARAVWHSAPTRPAAAGAIAMHCLRLAQRSLGLGRWPRWSDPPVPA